MTATESTPIDISWEEVGPRDEPEPRPASSPPGRNWTAASGGGSPRPSPLAENHLARTALGRMDALAAIPAFSRTAAALASDPTLPLQVGTKFATGMMRAFMAAGARAVGGKVDGPVDEGKDKRFADPTWSDNAAFWLLRQEFLVWERAMQELVELAPVDEKSPDQGRLPHPGDGRLAVPDQLLPDQSGGHAQGGRDRRSLGGAGHPELPATTW